MYIFKLRDGDICIPEKFYSSFLDIDWFISSLIKFNDASTKENDKIIEIYESKNAVLTMFDSIRFNKLVLYDESIDYLINLADYWCAPDWLQNELKEYKKNSFCKKININEQILQCTLCKTGFKMSENTHMSCKTHRNSTISNYSGNLIFSCCGRDKNEEPCLVGYHIPEKSDF